MGKTALFHALEFGKAAERLQSTDGIDVHRWTLEKKGRKITFSMWDFAGQDMYLFTKC